MQKLGVGFDPQRIPKDLLIEILSYAAENTYNIAPVCRVWSQLVKLERYWTRLVHSKLKQIIGANIDKERLAFIDVFCDAPYDLMLGQIQPLSFRQRIEWMFPTNQNMKHHYRVMACGVYHCFTLCDGGTGCGMRWIWDKKQRTDFAVEFGTYNIKSRRNVPVHGTTYIRWFPLHPTLHKQLRTSKSETGKREYVHEIWDAERKQMWRGPARTYIDPLTQDCSKTPLENSGTLAGVWYGLNNYTMGNMENYGKYFLHKQNNFMPDTKK